MEHLLRNSEEIRSAQLQCPDLDSDDFNNLLAIERKIADLYQIGILSDMDLIILDAVTSSKIYNDMSKSKQEKRTIMKVFSQICERIAYFLGGYFTDDGFVENLQDGYRLSTENLQVVKEYMSGRYESRTIRRTKTE